LLKNAKITKYMRRPNKKEFEIVKAIVALCSVSLLLFGANTLTIGYSQPQGTPPQMQGQVPAPQQQPPPQMQGQVPAPQQQPQMQGQVPAPQQQPPSQMQGQPQAIQSLQRTEDPLQSRIMLNEQRINQILEILAPRPLSADDLMKAGLTPQQAQQVQTQVQQARQALPPAEAQRLTLELRNLVAENTKLRAQLDEINLKENQAKRPTLLSMPFGRGQQQSPMAQQQQQIPVTVKFNSIKILNDQDPDGWGPAFKNIFSGKLSKKDAGDWILDAFVNGQNIHLSANRLLDEAFQGSTYTFPPTAQTTVTVPSNGILTINVRGADVDGCTTSDIPTGLGTALTSAGLAKIGLPNLPGKVTGLLNQKGAAGIKELTGSLDHLTGKLLGTGAGPALTSILGSSGLTSVLGAAGGPVGLVAGFLGPTVISNVKNYGASFISKICGGDNDAIGDVDQIYNAPFTPKTENIEADNGGYIITYTITPGR
jgi:hypothetical protein